MKPEGKKTRIFPTPRKFGQHRSTLGRIFGRGVSFLRPDSREAVNGFWGDRWDSGLLVPDPRAAARVASGGGSARFLVVGRAGVPLLPDLVWGRSLGGCQRVPHVLRAARAPRPRCHRRAAPCSSPPEARAGAVPVSRARRPETGRAVRAAARVSRARQIRLGRAGCPAGGGRCSPAGLSAGFTGSCSPAAAR